MRLTNGPGLIILAFAAFLLPEFGRAQAPAPSTPSPAAPAPAPENPATVERPDFAVKVPRPDAPALGDKELAADVQEQSENGVWHLRGKARIELHNATFTANTADYDENTHIFKAQGHVYYRNYEQNEVIYCDRAEYNTDTEHGTFYNPRGYGKTKVVARPGVLITQAPFYFQGMTADKLEGKYILHDGFITDCTVPNPWWTLHADLFDIIPEDRAIAHKAIYHLKGLPVFYFPYFYKSLKKEPRKSGFLSPNIGNSSTGGYLIGLGYYYAISRSLDLTYLFQDYTTRGYAHHVDFRGKPSQKSDFNMIFYGVQDRGYLSGGTLIKAPGYSFTGAGRTELGDGWIVRGSLDYISSLAFRQQFSQSFNEASGSETHSVGSVEKNFGYYDFHDRRLPNRRLSERNLGRLGRDPQTARIRPERPRPATGSRYCLPVWFSFDSSFGLFHRAEPTADPASTRPSQLSSRADLEPTVTTSIPLGAVQSHSQLHHARNVLWPEFPERHGEQQHSHAQAPEFNVDFVPPTFERIFNKKTFLGDKLKHVIEPRAEL